jgi:ABC-type nickel/cobalt efflux system permease component RcnA
MRTLLALGISGGIVPCPEALVVLLAAVKLHRIGYGMVLIAAFSIGLAAALILIGLTVVAAREKLSRFKSFGEDGALARYLPVGSAAVITLIGAALTLQAVGTP